ncbi:unnamed protein product [Oikopleura dioica]|uniref:Uncharacterized protein n=1 Tax=Oikopleura dioica TaxID=34765 RepID=E4XJ59_OIKDI|nr:unnamed protein product [Oikopleura dioica]
MLIFSAKIHRKLTSEYFWSEIKNRKSTSAHSTRLDKPEKTALAEFLRFLGLKKVFSNHQYLCLNSVRSSRNKMFVGVKFQSGNPSFLSSLDKWLDSALEGNNDGIQMHGRIADVFKIFKKKIF